jgi:DNA-binding HxlR family transcriptional regulator
MKLKMQKRSYAQWCAVARSLDIVGERWTLLIVRDLLLGAKRYGDLLAGLPGIGTNLLAQRLRELEDHGLVERAALPAPASANVYRLTEKGRALESVIFSLGRWGFEFLGKPRQTDAMLPEPFFVSLRASFRPERAAGLRERYAFHVDDRLFDVAIADGTIAIREGSASDADATVTTDAKTLFALRRRELTPRQAMASGALRVDGDAKAFERFVDATAWPKEMLAALERRAR